MQAGRCSAQLACAARHGQRGTRGQTPSTHKAPKAQICPSSFTFLWYRARPVNRCSSWTGAACRASGQEVLARAPPPLRWSPRSAPRSCWRRAVLWLHRSPPSAARDFPLVQHTCTRPPPAVPYRWHFTLKLQLPCIRLSLWMGTSSFPVNGQVRRIRYMAQCAGRQLRCCYPLAVLLVTALQHPLWVLFAITSQGGNGRYKAGKPEGLGYMAQETQYRVEFITGTACRDALTTSLAPTAAA